MIALIGNQFRQPVFGNLCGRFVIFDADQAPGPGYCCNAITEKCASLNSGAHLLNCITRLDAGSKIYEVL